MEIAIVDSETVVGLDEEELLLRMQFVLEEHRKPTGCLELTEDVLQVEGAVGRYVLSSRLCGTRYHHITLIGAITADPGYLVIIDLVPQWIPMNSAPCSTLLTHSGWLRSWTPRPDQFLPSGHRVRVTRSVGWR